MNKQRGYTLSEVVFAVMVVAVFGVLFGIGYAVVHFIIKFW